MSKLFTESGLSKTTAPKTLRSQAVKELARRELAKRSTPAPAPEKSLGSKALDFGNEVAKGIIKTPIRLAYSYNPVMGVSQKLQDKSFKLPWLGEISTYQKGQRQTLSDYRAGRKPLRSVIATGAEPLVDLASTFAGGGVVGSAAKTGGKQALIQSLKQGAKYGAGYGALNATKEGKGYGDIAKESLIGAGVGTAFGGALHGAGSLFRRSKLPQEAILPQTSTTEARLRQELARKQMERLQLALQKDRPRQAGYVSGVEYALTPEKVEINPAVARLRELENALAKRNLVTKKQYQSDKSNAFKNFQQEKEAAGQSISFFDDQIDSQYNAFKTLYKKFSHPKYREQLEVGDIDSIKRVFEGKMPKKEIDNIFYSGDKSENEVLDAFREMLFNKEYSYKKMRYKKPQAPIYQESTPEIEKARQEVNQIIEKVNAGEYIPPRLIGGGRIKQNEVNYRDFIEKNLGLKDKTQRNPQLEREIADLESQLKNKALFVQDMPQSQGRELSAGRKLITSGQRVLQESGGAGQELSRRIELQNQAQEMLRGRWQKHIDDALKGLTDEEAFNVTDVLEGAAKPMNKATGTAAKIMRNWLDKVARTAEERQFMVQSIKDGQRVSLPFKGRENYFPRHYDLDELAKGEKKEAALQALVDQGQARNKAEAEKMLTDFIFANRERKAGNLEFSRQFDIPGYERDPRKALAGYADAISRRFTEAEQFGNKDEIAAALIDKIANEGGDFRAAQTIFDNLYKGEPQQAVVAGALKFNTLTKLSLAFFSNATQSVNTATKGGVLNTAKAIAKQLTKKGRTETDDFAKLAGVYQDPSIKQELGFDMGTLMSFVMKPFQVVENFNRRVGATAGKYYSQELAKKLASSPESAYVLRSLESMGISPDKVIKGKLTNDDLLKAANIFTKKTQFLANSYYLPSAWRTPTGKLLTQFKSFSYMQTKFVRDEVLKEARYGNLAPLVRFVMLAPTASFAAQSLRNKVNQVEPERESVQPSFRKGDLYLKAAGLIPADLFSQYQYAFESANKPYTTRLRNIKNFTSPLIGPTLGEGLDLASALESDQNTARTNQMFYANHPEAQRDENLNMKRWTAGHIPFVGRGLNNTVFWYNKTNAQIAEELAKEGLRENNLSKLSEAMKIDPYLKKERVLKNIQKEVAVEKLSPKEKELYDKIKGMKNKPFY